MTQGVIDHNFGSIMVIVPHQDDEILMCAGMIEQAVREGLEVKVVMVTNGDYGSGGYSVGRARLRESIAGLEVLGLSKEHFILLGYADTGMPQEDSFLYHLYRSEDEKQILVSHCSDKTYGLEEQDEYHKAVYGEHADYNRENCLGDIRGVIALYQPVNIITTSSEDVHGDHSGLYHLVKEALADLSREGYEPAVYTGIVHSRAGDENWPERSQEIEPLTCPENFDNLGNLKWDDRIAFEVPDDMRQKDYKKNKKAVALSKHVTALKPDAVEFLYAFIKSDEIFWKVD